MMEQGFEQTRRLSENQTPDRLAAIEKARQILRAAGVVDPNVEASTLQAVNRIAQRSRIAPRREPEATPKVDLRQQTYDLLQHLRDPSAEEKKVLGERGIVFLPLEANSFIQLVQEDPRHFSDDDLDYGNLLWLHEHSTRYKEWGDYTLPAAVKIGLNPARLVLPGSYDFRYDTPGLLGGETHLELIEKYSKELQTEFPEARAIMLPAVGYAGLDRAYKKTTGEVLFKRNEAYCLDIVKGEAVRAGRLIAPDQSFFATPNCGIAAAVPVIVFVESK